MRSKRLARQIKKCFDGDLEEKLTSASADEALALLKAGLPEFLQVVDETYQQIDDKAALAERNLQLSSMELMEANTSLMELNSTFDAMVNSLGQGFFLFNAEGLCHKLCSKACEDLFEQSPAGRPILDVLKVKDKDRETLTDWYTMLFMDTFDFESLVKLGPSVYAHADTKRVIEIEYRPLRDRAGKLTYVVVVATDKTEEFEAKQEAKKMHAFATMVVQIIKGKQRFARFVTLVRDMIRECRELTQKPELGDEDVVVLKRLLHTIKGGSASYGMDRITDFTHELETRIGEIFERSELSQFLRTSARELDAIFEATLAENQDIIGEALYNAEPIREIPFSVLQRLEAQLTSMGFSLQDFHERFTEQLMSVPLEKVFAQFNPVVMDAASTLGKEVAPIRFVGGELRVIPERFETLLATLVHIFRNSVDHGLEATTERVEAGKDPRGQITVSFFAHGDDLEIQIADDGKGIDVNAIKSRARGLFDITAMSDDQIINLIFEEGFTTARALTEISGRGVGLNTVKAEVEKDGGRVTVESLPKRGSVFKLYLPDALVHKSQGLKLKE